MVEKDIIAVKSAIESMKASNWANKDEKIKQLEENLVLQANALGLFCHQTGGLNVEKARTAFNIPEGSEPVDVIAIGYLGNLDALPYDLREKELERRVRKPLTDFVFSERWGEVSQVVTE